MNKKEIKKYEKKLKANLKVISIFIPIISAMFTLDIKSLKILNQSGIYWILSSIFGLCICMILIAIALFIYLSEIKRIYK